MSSSVVTVVIVHRGRGADAARTVAAFVEQSIAVDLIIVDNGSDPARLSDLRAAIDPNWPVQITEAGENLGFGPGANVGLRTWLSGRGTSWAAVAPHDAMPAPDCLELLVAAAGTEPMAGLACADVGHGEVGMIDPYFGGLTRPSRRTDGWEDADYPHGTLMIINRRCAEEIGLFDERYFAYNEEADLGRRARLSGWRVGLVHGAEVVNTHLSTSVAAVDYLQHRNTLMMVREMSGPYHAFIRLIIGLGHVVTGVLVPARRPYVFHPRARLAGMWAFVCGRTGRPPDRWFRQRSQSTPR